MRISIIGTGYVGLVTGVGLASLGHKVVCVDIDEKKIEKINKGESPIYEKDLGGLLKKVIDKKLLSATVDLKSAVLNTEITFIAVPTPSKKNNDIDLSYIERVSQQIGSAIYDKKEYHTVVVKSTVVPETTYKVIFPLLKKYSKKNGKGFGLCMNPEFLREGNAVYDFMNPDRIIIGELDKKSGDNLTEVYKSFKTDILRTSLNNAEMIKYTNNALLATLISFSNEIANICEQIPGANAFEVLRGVYLDKRLNPVINGKRVNPEILTYLYPGCGFGGSCFPKDVKALISFSKKKGYKSIILSAVLNTNKKQPLRLVDLTEQKIGNLKNKKIALLGLSFKPDTDDIRESPAIPIVRKLINKKASVWVYDPTINLKKQKPILKNVSFSNSVSEAIKGKDACILITKWEEFKKITPELLKKEMANPLIVDGRGFFKNRDFKKKVGYVGIGLEKK